MECSAHKRLPFSMPRDERQLKINRCSGAKYKRHMQGVSVIINRSEKWNEMQGMTPKRIGSAISVEGRIETTT